MFFWFIIQHDSAWQLLIRTAASACTALLFTLMIGPQAIALLQRHCGERISSDSARLNRLHAAKAGTPSLGGLFVMLAVIAAVLVWGCPSSVYIWTAGLLLIAFTALGTVDDLIKLKSHRRGLTALQKLCGQSLIALIAGIVLYRHSSGLAMPGMIFVPLLQVTVDLGPLYILWAALVIVAGSNAVNLTDGLDGLAAGCTVSCGTALTVLALISGRQAWSDWLRLPFVEGSGEMAIVMAAMAGAMLGFLKFNAFPARVFSGDAGSLPVGGLLALSALICRTELLLLVVGGVFVAETASVLLQIGTFRLTGRRLFRCSPLHHHFQFAGCPEPKIVTRFWVSSLILALAGLIIVLIHASLIPV